MAGRYGDGDGLRILSDWDKSGRLKYVAGRVTTHHLERIVSKALAKDKAKRYQTITDFKLDLEQLREELHLSQSGVGSQARSQADPDATEPIGFVPSRAETVTAAITEPVGAAQTVSTLEAPREETSRTFSTRVERNKTLIIVVLAVALVAVLAAVYLYSSRGAIDSVAVLPFVNDSNDPNAEYLSDGITESIISSLSQLPNLKVMSRSAVFRFKGKNLDPQEIDATSRLADSLDIRDHRTFCIWIFKINPQRFAATILFLGVITADVTRFLQYIGNIKIQVRDIKTSVLLKCPRFAFLILVNISAIGSVIPINDSLKFSLPTRFYNTRYLPFEGEISKAYSTHIKFPVISPRPAANRTAIICAH